MSAQLWPDPLLPPEPDDIQALLARFWNCLAALADLLPEGECLLAAEQVAEARAVVIQLMLALNGIQRPPDTHRLNRYLSPAQRAALEKTLAAPTADAAAWVGQAVALVVIYRWYAPQLVDRYALHYPSAAEQNAWAALSHALPGWPQAVTTG
jgi:hypothetical protein